MSTSFPGLDVDDRRASSRPSSSCTSAYSLLLRQVSCQSRSARAPGAAPMTFSIHSAGFSATPHGTAPCFSK